MDITKFLTVLKERLRENIKEIINQVDKGELHPGMAFVKRFPVYVCEYTNQRMSPVTRLEVKEGKLVIYGDSDEWYADTRWSPEDVIQSAETNGKLLTKEQAISFLEDNSNHIVDAMVKAGWDAIEYLIGEDFPDLPDLPKEEQ